MIKVGLSNKKGFAPLSWLIQLILGTKYSHTYIYIVSQNRIFQASKGLVHWVNYDEFKIENNIITEVSIDIPEEKAVNICEQFEGKSYGFLTLVGSFFGLIGIKTGIGNDNHKTFICSELVLTVLEKAWGVTLKGDLDYKTPKDVEDLLWTIK